MKHQQAIFLQEMGITHWQVRKPVLFKADDELEQLNLTLCELLIVCTEADKSHALMPAIINAFDIELGNVVYCSLAQFESQRGTLPGFIWSTLGKIDTVANHQCLLSPSLAILATQRSAKKLLWKQFCATQQ